MSREKGKMRFVIPLMGIILVVSVMVMGYFQIKAAVRVGDLSGNSLRRSLFMSLSHASQELYVGERQLVTLVTPIGKQPDSDEISFFVKILDAWYSSELSSHIKGAYFSPSKSGSEMYRYFPDDENPVSVESSPLTVFRLPAFRRPEESGGIYIDIDMDILYGSELPEIMTNLGEDFAWRIVKSDGAVIGESGMEGIDYNPELRMPLEDKFLFFFNDLRGFQDFIKNGERSYEDNEPDFGPDSDEHHWGTLELYFTAGPLDRIVSRNIALNMAAGLAALTLILGSFLFLYRLYRTSEIHRLREQEFVSTISHELRTPLSVISSAGGNISRGIVKPERMGEYGNLITRETRRLEEMIEGVLFYSGLQRNSRKISIHEELDLNDFFNEIGERYRAKAEEMDVKLDIHLPGDLPPVKTSREGLSMVIGNLVQNGLLHAYPPGFRIDPDDRILSVDLKIENGKLIVFVSDRGCGIPGRERKKVFHAFVRGEKSRRNQIPGSGLGLHIALRVATLSGGTLLLIPDVEKGTIFKLILPVEVIDE